MSVVITLERGENEEEGVAIVWLSNEKAHNAMGAEFWEELPCVMAELGRDDSVRCILLAAKGRDFSVGIDLGFLTSTFGSNDGGRRGDVVKRFELRRRIEELQRVISSVARNSKPIIAAIHGYCLGGGVDLVTACDVRLATEDAVFSVRETRMAMVADLGSLQRLPALVGKGVALELALTGDDVGGVRACEIGLVNHVYSSRDQLLSAARSMAARIAHNSPLAVQGTKKVLRYCEGKSIADGLDYIAIWNAGFIESDDLREAISAFFDKREPVFKGR